MIEVQQYKILGRAFPMEGRTQAVSRFMHAHSYRKYRHRLSSLKHCVVLLANKSPNKRAKFPSTFYSTRQ